MQSSIFMHVGNKMDLIVNERRKKTTTTNENTTTKRRHEENARDGVDE